jgi:Major capsid protein 13-like
MALQNIGDFSTPTPVAIGSRGTPNWGSTFLGDLFRNERFKAAVYQEIYNSFAFQSSGIVAADSAINVEEGGVSCTLPMVLPFEPFEEVIESNDTWGSSGAGYLTPQKVNARTQIFPVMHRGFLVGADKLSKLGSGIDPLGAAAQYLGEALASHKSATLITMLAGLFASGGPLIGNLLDISRTGAGPSTGANFISASAVTRAKARLGERSRRLTKIAMHSDVKHYLEDLGMLQFSTAALVNNGAITWGGGGIGVTATDVQYFAGLQVVVDDRLLPTTDATNGDKYPVYLFADGVVRQGMQEPLNIDYGYNLESKQYMMSPDIHYSLGIYGLTYAGTLGSPTNTNLGTAANWAMAYTGTDARKLIPIVRMVVNCPLAANP